jgi:hypothetical protein
MRHALSYLRPPFRGFRQLIGRLGMGIPMGTRTRVSSTSKIAMGQARVVSAPPDGPGGRRALSSPGSVATHRRHKWPALQAISRSA